MKLGPFPSNASWGSSTIQAWLDRLRTYYDIFLNHIGRGGTNQHPIFTTTKAGFAPASGAEVGNFLRDDATWVAINTGLILVASLPLDYSTSASTTPIDLPSLAWNFEPNSTYAFRWVGNVSPDASTTGCGFHFALTPVYVYSLVFHHPSDNFGGMSGGSSVESGVSQTLSSGFPGTDVYPVSGTGILRTGPVAGTAQLKFQSETAAVITAKAGMTLIVEKMA